MRFVLCVLALALQSGCVAWQSSIDDMQSEISSFQSSVTQDTDRYRTDLLSALSSLESKLPEEIGKVRAELELAERRRELFERRRVIDTERKIEEISDANKDKNKAVLAELAGTAVSSVLGSPTGGALIRDVILKDGDIQSDFQERATVAIQESEQSSGIPFSDTQRDLGILAAGVAAYVYRNKTRKNLKAAS